MKCCESLAFLVRDAAHVTPSNFESCVHAIRSFVEATVNGGKLKDDRQRKPEPSKDRKNSKLSRNQKHKKNMAKTNSVPVKMSLMCDIEDGEDEGPPGGYHSLSIQLLDLMHTLHTRAASIFSSWAEEEQKDGAGSTIDAGASALWIKCWCPLLQGTVYKSWEPILLQSLANPFIFRCLDGTLIDGNDKGLSRMIYRSCTQRDRMGPYLTSDLSWLTNSSANPMAIGQYINNQNTDNEANVAYQEFDVPESFPFHLLRYIPNTFYSSTYQQDDAAKQRLMRCVVLVSLREIQCGEELFSSYFTIVH
ncbi:SET domain-containing protein 9-like isoform X4 [Asterias amurensis]|uniref:SET domain-containing protein 9-like isoform X4 n=1 Tax=Asterias amurensis TaxID=7602 RepID=UPI003AB52F04